MLGLLFRLPLAALRRTGDHFLHSSVMVPVLIHKQAVFSANRSALQSAVPAASASLSNSLSRELGLMVTAMAAPARTARQTSFSLVPLERNGASLFAEDLRDPLHDLPDIAIVDPLVC